MKLFCDCVMVVSSDELQSMCDTKRERWKNRKHLSAVFSSSSLNEWYLSHLFVDGVVCFVKTRNKEKIF